MIVSSLHADTSTRHAGASADAACASECNDMLLPLAERWDRHVAANVARREVLGFKVNMEAALFIFRLLIGRGT